MGKQERIRIAGIGLLYIVITCAFFLINKLCSFLLSRNEAVGKIDYFFQNFLLWAVASAVIIIVLSRYIWELNEGMPFPLLNDRMIRVTAGLLIILNGIVDLAGSVPAYIASIQSANQAARMMQQNMQAMLTEVIASAFISVLLILCRIGVGIYLIKFYKEK